MENTLANILQHSCSGALRYLNLQLIKFEWQLRYGNFTFNLVKSSINFSSKADFSTLFELYVQIDRRMTIFTFKDLS